MDYWRAQSVLGLSVPYTQDELKAAYRRRAKETHPDAGGDESAFKEVAEAYRTLDQPLAVGFIADGVFFDVETVETLDGVLHFRVRREG